MKKVVLLIIFIDKKNQECTTRCSVARLRDNTSLVNAVNNLTGKSGPANESKIPSSDPSKTSRNTLFDEIEEQKQNEENDSQHDRTSPHFIQELYKKLFHDLKEHLPAEFFIKKETPKKLSNEETNQIESRKQGINVPKTDA
ncbi:hypothetical protein HHI36_004661 [Cryptolaemus montrouzieri]|uniref:Uncharacterized protein n=1 Tax=Cryptolaemus montrouzieri TaxID=559131 RepID=A0ABD2NRU5_9CUCU